MNNTSLIDTTAEEAIAIWSQRKAERWIDTNRCTESFHSFARDEAGNLQGFHSDDTICEVIEFNLKSEAA